MRKVAPTLILSALIGWCLTAAAAEARAQQPLPAPLEKLFIRGVESLKAGDLDAAEKDLAEVLKQGGRGAPVYHNLGIVYQRRGDHRRAVVQFREAARLKPDDGPARLLLGASLLALGRPAEAAPELARAVELLPQEPQAHAQLAKAYERLDDWVGAAGQYRVLRDLAPGEAEYAYRLGRAYARISEWSYRRIIAINPDAARLHQALGHNYLLQEKYEEAIRAFRQAAKSDPRLPEIHLALALIFLEEKKFDEARKEIELELALVPGSKAALAARLKIDAALAGAR